MHAYSRDLALAHPDARQLGNAARLDAEIRERVDQRLLDGPHVGADVALPFAQVKDGIADDLAWAMIGNVAAAIRGMKGDARARQHFLTRQ